MKNAAIKTLLFSTVLTVTASGVAFAEDYNWSGVFIGGTAGATASTSESKVDYGSDLETRGEDDDYTVGWENGYFTGAIYDDMDELDMSSSSTDASEDTANNTDATIQELGALETWVDAFESTEMDWSANAILGAQWASGGVVLGAEVRGAFGNFDTRTSKEWNDGATGNDFSTCTTGSGGDTCGVDFTPVGENVTWDYRNDNAWNLTSPGTVSAGYNATYEQANSLSFGANYDKMLSPVAKLGVAVERVHMFIMGGPSWAKVEAVTSAHVDEEGHVDLATNTTADDLSDFDGDDAVGVSNGSMSYDWSGSNTKTMLGYSVGGGVEWAASDNVILRAEGLYTDLGTIRVTGVSDETYATYTVSQKLTNVSASAGVLFKF